MEASVKRFDWIAALALCLAFVIMVCPTEADILLVFVQQGEALLATLIVHACFITVLIPVVLSWRRHWYQSAVYRGRGYLIAATVILGINFLMFGSVLVDQWLKASGFKQGLFPRQNRSVEGSSQK